MRITFGLLVGLVAGCGTPSVVDGGAAGGGVGGAGGGGAIAGGVGGGAGGGAIAGGGTGGFGGGGDPGDAGSTSTFDVVIAGAGLGGSAAAIQAARLGMRVAVLEETDWVGGQATAAAESAMDLGTFSDFEYGLYGELITRVRAHYAARGKSISTCYYFPTQAMCFEPFVGARELEAMYAAAGNVVLFRRREVASVLVSGGLVSGVRTSRGETFLGRVVIDATEYGDLLPLAGIPYRVGNTTSAAVDAGACIQDLTYVGVIRSYSAADASVPAGFLLQEDPPGYAAVKPEFQLSVALDGAAQPYTTYPINWGVHAAYRGMPDSRSAGSFDNTMPWDAVTKTGINFANDWPGFALDHPAWPDAGLPRRLLSVRYLEDRSYRRQADCEARLRTLQFLRYLQTDLARPDWSFADEEGFDNADGGTLCANLPASLEALQRAMPPIPYVRESRRMQGGFTFTAKDMVEVDAGSLRIARTFPDSIGYGGYGNDLHNCEGEQTLEQQFESRADLSTWGRVFQVPMAAFVPPLGFEGFLPAEKNFSQTRLANGATRLHPPMMGLGQAVGVMAALSIRRNQPVRTVPAVLVQDALVRAGARISLYRFSDLLRGDPDWPSVELVSARGIMVGNTTFAPDLALSRAQAALVFSRAFGLDTSSPPANPTFADVPPTHLAYAAIEAFHAAGYTQGCATAPLRFCPDDPATRAAMAVFLVKALGLDVATPPATPTFSDVPQTFPTFAQVEAVQRDQVLEGCTATTFCPAQAVTRREAARALHRALVKQAN